MKSVLIVLLLLPGFCLGQGCRKSRPKFILMLPNAGVYSSHQTDLINWIRMNGGEASNITYGGDLFNVSYLTNSDFIIGIGAGGLYSGTTNSSLRISYGDFQIGKPIFRNELIQANIFGHLSYLGYTVLGIIPPNVPLPASNNYYLRGTTFGAGASLQVVVKIRQFENFSVNAGFEYGLTFINPQPSWQFGYDATNQNGSRAYFRGVSVSGPDVDSMISYFRLSWVFKF